MPDIEPFVSPIDGRVITGRAGLRAHNKEHNVTNVADYKNEWAKKSEERERFYSGGSYDKERRIDALKRAYEKLHKR